MDAAIVRFRVAKRHLDADWFTKGITYDWQRKVVYQIEIGRISSSQLDSWRQEWG